MQYYIYPFKEFKKKYFSELVTAQLEIYPDEPRASPIDTEPYEDNAWVISAEDTNGLAGFSAFAIFKETRNCNYFGSNLYFYVKPAYRKTIVAGKLMKKTEKFAETQGCFSFKWDINIKSDLINVFNKRKEYKKESIVYSKNLIYNT